MSTNPTPSPPTPHIYASAARASESPDHASILYDATLHDLTGQQQPMPTVRVPSDVAEDGRHEMAAMLGQVAARIQSQGGQPSHADVAQLVGFVEALKASPSRPAAPTQPQTWTAPDPQP